MKGYEIRKVYVIICLKCQEDITRPQSGEEPSTRAEAEEYVKDHEKVWH
jgi:hypothetical protein